MHKQYFWKQPIVGLTLCFSVAAATWPAAVLAAVNSSAFVPIAIDPQIVTIIGERLGKVTNPADIRSYDSRPSNSTGVLLTRQLNRSLSQAQAA